MRIALANFFLKPVPVSGAGFKLHVDLRKLLAIPVQPRLVARAAVGGVEVEHQRLTGLGIPPAGVARFSQQLFGSVNRLTLRPIVAPVIQHRVHRAAPLFKAKDTGRYWPLRRNCAAIQKDRNELLKIDRNRQCLAQLAVALCSFRVTATHHRVKPVEREVIGGGGQRGAQLDAARFHLGGQTRFAVGP